MTEQEKIDAGILFFPGDPELKAKKRKAHNLNIDFNRLHEDETEAREEILRSLLGRLGKNHYIQGPITFHYGCHTFIGDDVFINFNFTVQDDAVVTIGDGCNFGPNVTIVTPLHPMVASERRAIRTAAGEDRRLCWAKPVAIGKRCWICANVVILPGVTVGDDCVIGAGSVVTRDVPAGCFAAGNPCRVIRPITEKDSMKNFPEILADNAVIG